jgi:hypothetical protein
MRDNEGVDVHRRVKQKSIHHKGLGYRNAGFLGGRGIVQGVVYDGLPCLETATNTQYNETQTENYGDGIQTKVPSVGVCVAPGQKPSPTSNSQGMSHADNKCHIIK